MLLQAPPPLALPRCYCAVSCILLPHHLRLCRIAPLLGPVVAPPPVLELLIAIGIVRDIAIKPELALATLKLKADQSSCKWNGSFTSLRVSASALSVSSTTTSAAVSLRTQSNQVGSASSASTFQIFVFTYIKKTKTYPILKRFQRQCFQH